MHVDCALAERTEYRTVAEVWDLASEDEREADMIVTMTGDMHTTLFLGFCRSLQASLSPSYRILQRLIRPAASDAFSTLECR